MKIKATTFCADPSVKITPEQGTSLYCTCRGQRRVPRNEEFNPVQDWEEAELESLINPSALLPLHCVLMAWMAKGEIALGKSLRILEQKTSAGADDPK